MPRRKLAVIFTVWLIIAAAFGAYHVWRTPDIRHIRLAAGTSGGTYDAMARGIKAAIERRVPAVRVTILETGGSEDNVKLLAAGQADLGFVQAGSGA
jgi:hypothetical protein